MSCIGLQVCIALDAAARESKRQFEWIGFRKYAFPPNKGWELDEMITYDNYQWQFANYERRKAELARYEEHFVEEYDKARDYDFKYIWEEQDEEKLQKYEKFMKQNIIQDSIKHDFTNLK